MKVSRLRGHPLALAPLALVVAGLVVWAKPDTGALTKSLNAGIAGQNTDQVQKALTGLIEAGGKDALTPVLTGVQKTYGKGSMSVYWQLVSGAAGFRDKAALQHLGDFLVKTGKKKAPFARDLLFGLENNSSPHVILTLKKVLAEKKAYDLQLMAVDQLGQVHTVAAVDALIDLLKAEGKKGDPQLRSRALIALGEITKENLGGADNWIDWWKVQRGKGLPKAAEESADGEHMGGGGGDATTRMRGDRKKQFESLQKGKDRILVISSKLPDDHPKQAGHDYNYDHMEKILERMKVPHKVVKKADFEKDPNKYLKDAWTVLVNCNNIQKQCVCKTCVKLLNEMAAKGGSLGAKTNRLYRCPAGCTVHDQVSFRMNADAVEKLKRWVEAGGYLFTEDWGLIEIVEAAWPKLVTSDTKTDANTKQQSTTSIPTMNVTIMPGPGMTSRPILRGVFTKPRPPAREKKDGDADGGTRVRDLDIDPTKPPSHKWKIDDQSPAIKVLGRNVEVLMRSEELGKNAGGMDAVAVSFRVGNGKPAFAKKKKKKRGPVTGGGGRNGGLTGKSRGRGAWGEALVGGRVLHVLSHFGKQQGSAEDTFVLQNLILNFIMESNRQHGG